MLPRVRLECDTNIMSWIVVVEGGGRRSHNYINYCVTQEAEHQLSEEIQFRDSMVNLSIRKKLLAGQRRWRRKGRRARSRLWRTGNI